VIETYRKRSNGRLLPLTLRLTQEIVKQVARRKKCAPKTLASLGARGGIRGKPLRQGGKVVTSYRDAPEGGQSVVPYTFTLAFTHRISSLLRVIMHTTIVSRFPELMADPPRRDLKTINLREAREHGS